MVSRQSRMVISVLSSGYLLLAVLFFNISLGWFTPVDHLIIYYLIHIKDGF